MGLTAQLSTDGPILDATQEDLGAGMAWEQVYRVKPRADLRCRTCGWTMQAKQSQYKRRSFAHDPGSQCPTREEDRSEGPLHREIKRRCAEWIREVDGWTAELETPGGDPGDQWRADVLATGPDGRRIAFEIQASDQTADKARARAARYARYGITCVWIGIAAKSRGWYATSGALDVSEPILGERTGDDALLVREGCRRYREVTGAAGARVDWKPPEEPPQLKHIVQCIVDGRVVPSRPDPHELDEPWWWVPRAERARADELDDPGQLQRRAEDRHQRQRELVAQLDRDTRIAANTPTPSVPGERTRHLHGELVKITVMRKPTPRSRKPKPTTKPFALVLPEAIAPSEQKLPVLVDDWRVALQLAQHYPRIQVVVSDGEPPWPRYQRRDGEWVATGMLGKTDSAPARSPKPCPSALPATQAAAPAATATTATTATEVLTAPTSPAEARPQPPAAPTPSSPVTRPKTPASEQQSPQRRFTGPVQPHRHRTLIAPWRWPRRWYLRAALLVIAVLCVVLAVLL